MSGWRAYSGKALRVPDGCSLVVRLSFEPFGLHLDALVRLDGIAAPEMVGPTAELGARCRAFLERLVGSHELELAVQAQGVGRYVASVVVPGVGDAPPFDLADRLLTDGYAQAWTGGAYPTFDAATYPAG